MRSWQFGGALWVLFAFGCGGISQRDGSHDSPDARGGASAIAAGIGGSADAIPAGLGGSAAGAFDVGIAGIAGTFDVGIGGSAGVLSVAQGAAAGAAGSLCSAQPACDTSAAYVDVSDTATVRLAYFADTDPGASDGTCHVVATGVSGCGVVNLSLSACSAPNGAGVCLDMASSERHYTDGSGTLWNVLRLSGSSSQLKGEQAEGVVDLDLTLALGSDSTYHELAAHVHACARIVPTLIPCK